MTTGTRIRFSQLRRLVSALGLRMPAVVGWLSLYYTLTIANALLEGIGTLLLVNVFTGGGVGSLAAVPQFVTDALAWLGRGMDLTELLPVLIALFALNFVLRMVLYTFDGTMTAVLRQRVQEAVFTRYLRGDWAYMRDFRVGDAVGTNTQEALVVSKYLTSAVSALQYLLAGAIIAVLAVSTSLAMTIGLGAIALPLLLVLQQTFRVQARLSKESALLRNEFSGDITDRFNGLLQVHVDYNYDYHLRQGLRTQRRLTVLDFWVGVCQALISSFNLLLPLSVLGAFAIWLKISGSSQPPDLALVASVGVLGLRGAAQLNAAVAAIGNLSRLSGSLYPVMAALEVPSTRDRELIGEPVVEVQLQDVGYRFGEHAVIEHINVTARKGAPLVLSGRSGQGKTTLANIAAGLYFPSAGRVHYVGASGAHYDSATHRARVGFVTQDIYLFRGSLRESLTAGRPSTDESIWQALQQVDAEEFVRAMGGLDTTSAEAGRSLSGGQRRRLGIARVLLSGSDLLIFDEVTAGLDQANKSAVLDVIERLSERYVVIVISHDPLSWSQQLSYAV